MAFKRKPLPANVRRVISLGNNFRGVTTNRCGHLVQFESEQERKLLLLIGHIGGLEEPLHTSDTPQALLDSPY
jgi:hypothetical protein